MVVKFVWYFSDSFWTKTKLQSHEKHVKIKISVIFKIPKEFNKILKGIQGQKIYRMSSIAYTDSESVFEKVYSFEHNPENSLKTTIFTRFGFY